MFPFSTVGLGAGEKVGPTCFVCLPPGLLVHYYSDESARLLARQAPPLFFPFCPPLFFNQSNEASQPGDRQEMLYSRLGRLPVRGIIPPSRGRVPEKSFGAYYGIRCETAP